MLPNDDDTLTHTQLRILDSGGISSRRKANNSLHWQSSNHEKSAHINYKYGKEDLAAQDPRRARERQRLVHVPGKQQANIINM